MRHHRDLFFSVLLQKTHSKTAIKLIWISKRKKKQKNQQNF